MKPRLMAAWWMLLMFSSLAIATDGRVLSRAPAELSNSFIITSLQDLEKESIHGQSLTACEYAINRARSIGGKHFSIVVTAYWIGGQRVDSWGFKDVSSSYPSGYGYLKPTTETISRWKRGLQNCFRSAILSGFTGIQVLNHVDDAEGKIWRNLVEFDPLGQYGGFSYEDVVVRPAADALRTVTRPSTKVWFMVMGEQGRSLFKHPGSYMKLISKYRGTLARGKVGTNVKVGLAFHWNKVCGDCFPMPYTTTAQQYNDSYAKAFAEQASSIKATYDLTSLKRIFEVCDVLGISHYAPMPTSAMNFASFELPFMTAAYELKFWGINLKTLVMQASKDIIFSEVGLGGASPDGSSTATSLQDLAQNVERGIWAEYNTAQDPWRRQDFRDYRKKWFYNLLGFLRYGGSPNVRISAAFVWSVGSFDVAGVHPISSSNQGSYADPEIVGWMKRLSAMGVY